MGDAGSAGTLGGAERWLRVRSLRAALRSDVSSSHPVLRGLVGILTVISLIAGILAMHALGVESLGSVGAEPAIAQPAVASVADASHTSPGAAALSVSADATAPSAARLTPSPSCCAFWHCCSPGRSSSPRSIGPAGES